ncbi:MAG: C4-type zinc ribbon domain-containing protein [Nitrospira sp.]|nr:C4-type zinc ribbon domain-containing protein [Nitrospira sp.]MDH4304754.1 C4-type zinc ribbon domain-containing protein [Nitrospira sp.]
MNQKLSPLIELQKLDLRIMEITEIRKKIPERLHVAETPLREVTKALTDTKSAIDAATKERRTHEKDLEVHESNTEKMKSHAANLKTNKEYQAHLFELELANKKRGEFEEKILLAMEKIDELQKVAKELQEKKQAHDNVFAQEKQGLDAQDKELAKELAQVEADYREAAGKVEKSLLDRYNQVKASRKDQPLAAVRDGKCMGCRLQIPPQLIAQVRRSDDLHLCPYCRRILYWEGEPAKERASALSEARKADFEVGESV